MVLALQLCSFFRVVCVDFLCISIWSLESGSLFVQKAFWHFDLACVEYMDQFGECWHVHNIKYSDPTTKCTFRFGCSHLVAQLCLILGIPCTWEIPQAFPSVSSVHVILQARILAWVTISFSRGSSRLWDGIRVSCITGGFFTNWETREAHF